MDAAAVQDQVLRGSKKWQVGMSVLPPNERKASSSSSSSSKQDRHGSREGWYGQRRTVQILTFAAPLQQHLLEQVSRNE